MSDLEIVLQPNTWTNVTLPIYDLSLDKGRVTQIKISGAVKDTFYIDDMKLVAQEIETSVEKSQGLVLPSGYTLSQNYPNPFNPATTIKYDLPKPGHVRLAIYDLLGRHIRTLVDTKQPAGHFQTSWDGTDERNMPVAAGVYFCRMEAKDFVKVIKLALVK